MKKKKLDVCSNWEITRAKFFQLAAFINDFNQFPRSFEVFQIF